MAKEQKKAQKENEGFFKRKVSQFKEKVVECALETRKTDKTCDPVYRKLVVQMVDEHKDSQNQTALIVMNSFDCDKDEIEQLMTERKVIAEVFEIDRLRKEDRNDYLNCFHDIYKTKELPMIFIKDQFVGNLKQLHAHLDANKML